MIKILKHGYKKIPIYYTLKCSLCHCKFRVGPEDWQKDNPMYSYIYCPDCGHDATYLDIIKTKYRREKYKND